LASIAFTPNLRRHLSVEQCIVEGGTVSILLENLFKAEPLLRGYLLDDQGDIRKHVNVFLDDNLVTDLSTAVAQDSEVFIMQALSGG